ncbi:MAG: glycosyltransferase family 4 protein [Armatimonadetes bacterium]|nr:glycosyltransferase family 4 protein [Armatimonadota bacterium]
MKVLHVHTDLHGGGIERLMTGLAREQARAGVHSAICYFPCGHGPPPAALCSELTDAGVALLPIHATHVVAPDYAVKLGRVLRAFRPDILHLHGGTIGGIGAVVGRWCRVPVIVYTEHLPCYPTADAQSPHCHARWIRWLRSLTAPLLDCSVAVSEAVRSTIPRGSKAVSVIANGIDLDRYRRLAVADCRHALRARLGLGPDTLLVVGVGSLTPRKAYHHALEAVSEVRKRQKAEVHLILCGDGPERDNLLSRAEALGLPDRLHLLGWVDNVAEVLVGCDIFIHPALDESFGLVLVEAAAAGIPVLVTHVGGLPEVIEEGVTGLLVEPGSADALASALCELVADPERGKQLSRRGRERAERLYGLETCNEAYVTLYEALLSGKGRTKAAPE